MIRRWRRLLLAALLAMLTVGLIAPFLDAAFYRPKIQRALEAALKRPVEIGDVRLNLLTGPGFTLKNVLIGDDPSAGIEPFAHMTSLQARLKLSSILSGHLAFSHLRLIEPTVNVVKTSEGWNLSRFLNGAVASEQSSALGIPDITISDGSLNFKFGDTKSVFYVHNADADIYPVANGDLVIRFSGEPARSDRANQAFGRFSARGMLKAGRLNMGLHLERTSIGDVIALVYGRDVGIHGFTVANAHIEGPLSRIDVSGNLTMDDFHRWDLMPVEGEPWNLALRGYIDLAKQEVEIETVSGTRPPLPASLKLRATAVLSNPQVGLFFAVKDLAANSFFAVARNMGVPLPPKLEVSGNVSGAVGLSAAEGIHGSLSIHDGSIRLRHGDLVHFDALRIVVQGKSAIVGPAELVFENEQTALIEGEYALDGRAIALRLSSRELTAENIDFDTIPVPVIEHLKRGSFRGWIEYERTNEETPAWRGAYEIQNAVFDVPAVALPVRLDAGTVKMESGGVTLEHLRGRVGNTSFQGDYAFDLAGQRPQSVHLVIPELRLEDAERIWMPTLRRRRSFLERTFSLKRPAAPEWLTSLKVDGRVQVNQLLYGDAAPGSFRAKLAWRGTRIHFSDAEYRGEKMQANGEITATLTEAAPDYRVAGRVQGLEYKGGTLDLEGECETTGFGNDLLANAHGEFDFHGLNLSLGPETELDEIAGTARVTIAGGSPRLDLENIEAVQSGEAYTGQGTAQPDGRIVLDLTSGRKQVRMTVMLTAQEVRIQ